MLFRSVAGRLQRVEGSENYSVLVDYAHTPDGLANVLTAVKEFSQGRIITVFGCGGDRDHGKRPQMGELAGRLSDYAIITSDNPRTEDPLAIIADVEAGIKPVSQNYMVEPDRRAAIGMALAMAGPDDLVLIAGKGHEDYQLVNGRVLDFDDRKVAREFLTDAK